MDEQVSDEMHSVLTESDSYVAGVIAQDWSEATRAEDGDLTALWQNGAGHGWFELTRGAALDLAVATTRRLGRAACPLLLLDGYAAELFDLLSVETDSFRVVITTEPSAASSASTEVRDVPGSAAFEYGLRQSIIYVVGGCTNDAGVGLIAQGLGLPR